MADEREKLEKSLIKLLELQKEQNIQSQDLMIMMSLLGLMGMIDVINRDAGSVNAGAGNMQSLIAPLMGLMAAGMGNTRGDGKQAQFNPAMLMSLLSSLTGGQAKGGQQPDLSGLMGLLGPLFGGMQGGAPQQGPSQNETQTVQREINLDEKKKTAAETVKKETAKQELIKQKTVTQDSAKLETVKPEAIKPEIIKKDVETQPERPPKAGEVLKWNFGAS